MLILKEFKIKVDPAGQMSNRLIENLKLFSNLSA